MYADRRSTVTFTWRWRRALAPTAAGLALLLLAGLVSVGDAAPPPDSARLMIDPLLVAQAAEVWSVIGGRRNPVWPGWDASRTPILFYLPGQQEVLINHPSPPAGFVRYTGPVHFPGGTVFVHNGPTMIDLDGQNTSMDVNGTPTLVVADTLSTRRQRVEGLIRSASAGGRSVDQVVTSNLRPAPCGDMLTIVHEAFHVYQALKGPGKRGQETALERYPSLSPENNAAMALEAEILQRALTTPDPRDLKRDALRWLAVRQDRRKGLTPDMVAYEDGTEFSEGTAKYTEYRLLQVLDGKRPSPAMWWMQGFEGYENLAPQRRAMLDQMVAAMDGSMIVNNDPYGASPVRMRLYHSGMAIGALLDRLGANWHERLFTPRATLTGLVAECLAASDSELSAIAAAEKMSPHYREVLARKQALAQDGEEFTRRQLAQFDTAPGKLVIDYSALTDTAVRLRFTPFGILRVDDDRTIFRLLPMVGQIGSCRFSEDGPRDVLQDRAKRQLTILLTAPPDLQGLRAATAEGGATDSGPVGRLDLPGARVEGGTASTRLVDKTLIVTLRP